MGQIQNPVGSKTKLIDELFQQRFWKPTTGNTFCKKSISPAFKAAGLLQQILAATPVANQKTMDRIFQPMTLIKEKQEALVKPKRKNDQVYMTLNSLVYGARMRNNSVRYWPRQILARQELL